MAPSDAPARELNEALVTEAAERAGYPRDVDAREGLFDGLLGGLQRRLSWLANRSRLDELVIAAIFRDVAAYLSSTTVRDAVLDTVLAGTPTSGEIVLVSHSLGTVVAMDLVTRLPDAIDVTLLVTAGSPLGMDTVFDRLLTKGPHRPSRIGAWINVWSPADPVAIGLPPCSAARASMPGMSGTCLEDEVEGRLGHPTEANPPAVTTSRMRASPACAPRAASTPWERDIGRQMVVEAEQNTRPTGVRLSSSRSLANGSTISQAPSSSVFRTWSRRRPGRPCRAGRRTR
jgi:hypothetical protein